MASQNFGSFIDAAAAATLAGADLIPAVQSSVTKKTTVNAIIALIDDLPVPQGGTGLGTLTANAVLIGAGTGNVQFATIGTAGRILVDQGAAANPAFVVMSGAGSMTLAGVVTINKVTGITDGSSAAAGIVGEIFTSTVALGAAVSVVSLTAKTITSITLTAGRWALFGLVGAAGAGTTAVLQLIGDINTVTNALSADESHYAIGYYDSAGTGRQPQVAVPMQYVTVSLSTTFFLVARVQFTISTCTAFGRITAVRI